MPCRGCAAKFGFLSKERECPSCGFAFCSSCLKYKCSIPKLGEKPAKVCRSCSLPASSNDSKSGMEKKIHVSPPDIFLRRLEALENPPNPPITVYHDKPRLQQLLQGLNSTDLEIALRLKKLRDERRGAKHVPTDEEIATRLAKLRDQDPSQASSTATRPSLQSSEDQLLNQTAEAMAMESTLPKPEDKSVERLRQLRQDVHSLENKTASITLDEVAELLSQCKMEAGEGGAHPDLATVVSLEKLRVRLMEQRDKMEQETASDEEESAIQKIIAKATAEVEVEQRLGINVDVVEEMDDDLENKENEELPWCVICNEDACIRCLDCDRDLYCKDCYQQGHKDTDMRDHVFQSFKQK